MTILKDFERVLGVCGYTQLYSRMSKMDPHKVAYVSWQLVAFVELHHNIIQIHNNVLWTNNISWNISIFICLFV